MNFLKRSVKMKKIPLMFRDHFSDQWETTNIFKQRDNFIAFSKSQRLWFTTIFEKFNFCCNPLKKFIFLLLAIALTLFVKFENQHKPTIRTKQFFQKKNRIEYFVKIIVIEAGLQCSKCGHCIFVTENLRVLTNYLKIF